jgi:bidirectional [NiFe] hydrogenase diaphorase subunit
MPDLLTRPAPPSEDKRWRVVEATMRRNGYQPNGLIETMHTLQEMFGFIDESSMRYVAASLHVPLSKVYGVATFYHFFSLKPQGKHVCVVCMGTSCYIKGAPALLSALETEYGIKPGETTSDGETSLMIARCVGSCGQAPVCVLDGAIAASVTPEGLIERLRSETDHDA